MAQNDMYVVMYKIIAYLYDCMKRGERPRDDEWSPSALGVPEPYWTRIVEELTSHGLVGGVNVFHGSSSTAVVPVEPYVTMEGVAFVQENSMMGKARQFLIDAKASIPFV